MLRTADETNNSDSEASSGIRKEQMLHKKNFYQHFAEFLRFPSPRFPNRRGKFWVPLAERVLRLLRCRPSNITTSFTRIMARLWTVRRNRRDFSIGGPASAVWPSVLGKWVHMRMPSVGNGTARGKHPFLCRELPPRYRIFSACFGSLRTLDFFDLTAGGKRKY